MMFLFLTYVINHTQSLDLTYQDYIEDEEPEHFSWRLGEPDNKIKVEVIYETSDPQYDLSPDEYGQH